MSNRQEQMEQLDKINDERMAKDLPMFGINDVDTALEWKASDEGTELVKEDGSVDSIGSKPKETLEKESDGSVVIDEAEGTKKPSEKEETLAKSSLPDPAKIGDAESSSEVAELKKEIARLKQEDGRARVLSDEVKELREKFESEKQRADEAVQKVQTSSSNVDLTSMFTQEELDDVDMPTLEKVSAIADRRAERLFQQKMSEITAGNTQLREQLEAQGATVSMREQQFAEQSRADMIESVNEQIPESVYAYIDENPDKWEAWNNKSYGGTTEGALYASAIETFDADATASQLRKFMSNEGIKAPVKREKLPLKTTQRQSESVIETNPNDKIYSYEDVVSKMTAYKHGRLPKGWSQSDFEKHIDKVTDAAEKGMLREKNGTGRSMSMPLG